MRKKCQLSHSERASAPSALSLYLAVTVSAEICAAAGPGATFYAPVRASAAHVRRVRAVCPSANDASSVVLAASSSDRHD